MWIYDGIFVTSHSCHYVISRVFCAHHICIPLSFACAHVHVGGVLSLTVTCHGRSDHRPPTHQFWHRQLLPFDNTNFPGGSRLKCLQFSCRAVKPDRSHESVLLLSHTDTTSSSCICCNQGNRWEIMSATKRHGTIFESASIWHYWIKWYSNINIQCIPNAIKIMNWFVEWSLHFISQGICNYVASCSGIAVTDFLGS